MQITGKYLKIRDIETGNGYKKITLSEGEKKYKSEEWDNWRWFNCFLVGKAKDIELHEGDKIEIISGKITKREHNGKWYDNITIFELEVMQRAEGSNTQQSDLDDPNIPF